MNNALISLHSNARKVESLLKVTSRYQLLTKVELFIVYFPPLKFLLEEDL